MHTVEQNVVVTSNSDTTPDGKFSSVFPGGSKTPWFWLHREDQIVVSQGCITSVVSPVHSNFTPECNYLATLCMSNIQDLYSNAICTNMLVPSTHIMSLLCISGLTAIYYEQIV